VTRTPIEPAINSRVSMSAHLFCARIRVTAHPAETEFDEPGVESLNPSAGKT
jgi:hypothetical protein